MGVAFIPSYVHYLGIESYGLIGLFALLQAWLFLLDMGMTPTLVREMGRFSGGSLDAASLHDVLRTVEILAVAVAALMTTGIWLSSTWLASNWLQSESLPVPIVSQAFATMGLVAAIRFVEGIYRSCMIGLQRQVKFNLINSTMATARGLGATAILAWVSPTIYAFFLWQCVISIATLALMAITTYSSLPACDRYGRFSFDALRQLWKFARGMLCINLLALLLTQIDKVLLSKILSLTEFGYYTLAATVAGVVFRLVSPVTQAYFPRLSELHASEDNAGLARTYHQGAQLVTVILGSTTVVLMAYARTFLELWTQDSELARITAPLIVLLLLGNLLNGLMWIPYQTQLAHGWTTLTMRVNIVAVLIVIPAILWATPRYGTLGAAWVWVGLNAGYLSIGVHFMFRKILTAEKWRWYKQDILQPLLASIATVATIRMILPNPVGTVSQIGTLVFASAASLLAVCISAPLVHQQIRLATEHVGIPKALHKLLFSQVPGSDRAAGDIKSQP